MNNPPTTEPVEHETEHYAPHDHDVSKHVRGYLLVGGSVAHEAAAEDLKSSRQLQKAFFGTGHETETPV